MQSCVHERASVPCACVRACVRACVLICPFTLMTLGLGRWKCSSARCGEVDGFRCPEASTIEGTQRATERLGMGVFED